MHWWDITKEDDFEKLVQARVEAMLRVTTSLHFVPLLAGSFRNRMLRWKGSSLICFFFKLKQICLFLCLCLCVLSVHCSIFSYRNRILSTHTTQIFGLLKLKAVRDKVCRFGRAENQRNWGLGPKSPEKYNVSGSMRCLSLRLTVVGSIPCGTWRKSNCQLQLWPNCNWLTSYVSSIIYNIMYGPPVVCVHTYVIYM